MSPVPWRRDKTILKAVPTIKGVHFFSSAHCLVQWSVLLQQGVLCISMALYLLEGFYHPFESKSFSSHHVTEGGKDVLGYCKMFCQSLCQSYCSLRDEAQVNVLAWATAVERAHSGKSPSSPGFFIAFSFKTHGWQNASCSTGYRSICISEVGRYPAPRRIWPIYLFWELSEVLQ